MQLFEVENTTPSAGNQCANREIGPCTERQASVDRTPVATVFAAAGDRGGLLAVGLRRTGRRYRIEESILDLLVNAIKPLLGPDSAFLVVLDLNLQLPDPILGGAKLDRQLVGHIH